jgi:hypothetical protein
MEASPTSAPGRLSRRARFALAVGIPSAIVLLVSALVPLPIPFSERLAANCFGPGFSPSQPTITFPAGAEVEFRWSVNGSTPVDFSVVGNEGTVYRNMSALSGSVDFTADGRSYTLTVLGPCWERVTVAGTYKATILQAAARPL